MNTSFRPMRRGKQALTQEECIDLLKTETRGVLSVLGDNGYPYGIPINHYYCEEDGRLYFHGGNIGHRVDAIKKDPKVSFCVFGKDEKRDGDWAYYVKSVVVFGKAQIIEDRDKTAFVSRLISSKFPATDEYVEHEISKFGSSTLCFSIQIESMTGKLVHEA